MSSKPAGRVSPMVMADCAGLVPVLVRVKTSVVLAPSTMGDVPKVLATDGAAEVTLKHRSIEVLVAPVVVTLAPRLVCGACGQVPVCPAVLVTPDTVTVQLAVPLLIATPVRPESTRVPAVYTAAAGPLQPAP